MLRLMSRSVFLLGAVLISSCILFGCKGEKEADKAAEAEKEGSVEEQAKGAESAKTEEPKEAPDPEAKRAQDLAGALGSMYGASDKKEIDENLKFLEENKSVIKKLSGGSKHHQSLVDCIELVGQMSEGVEKKEYAELLPVALEGFKKASQVRYDTMVKGTEISDKGISAAASGNFKSGTKYLNQAKPYLAVANLATEIMLIFLDTIDVLMQSGPPEVRLKAFESIATLYPEVKIESEKDDLKKNLKLKMLSAWTGEDNAGNKSKMEEGLKGCDISPDEK